MPSINSVSVARAMMEAMTMTLRMPGFVRAASSTAVVPWTAGSMYPVCRSSPLPGMGGGNVKDVSHAIQGAVEALGLCDVGDDDELDVVG